MSENRKMVTVEADMETGFAYGLDENGDNVFQACLSERADKQGYKKEIKSRNDGCDWGICGDYNKKIYQDEDSFWSAHEQFLKVARKSGIRVV